MKASFSNNALADLIAPLRQANDEFARQYSGETGRRQPVHTVYGGAHLFKADSAKRLGSLAQRALDQFAPDYLTFAKALHVRGTDQLPGTMDDGHENNSAWLAHTIYNRVSEKLRREPVEDFRIDFEDGYGNRPDDEEDGHAAAAATEVAKGNKEGTLPPFIGIRIKPFNEELRARSFRTLDIFVSTLLEENDGRLPNNFVVTLPKITIPQQVATLA